MLTAHYCSVKVILDLGAKGMIYRFGDCELDDSLYQLRRGGVSVEIEPKVFDVLCYLAQHHERLVSKEELLKQLWPGQVVGPDALVRSIMAARKAVGDDRSKQLVIQTYHGRGYRFVAPLTSAPLPGREFRVQPLESESHNTFRSTVQTLDPRRQTPDPALPLPNKPSIAVLPFTNMSGDPEQEYFSDGLTEDLITDLSQLSGLFVIARHSVFAYKGKAVKVEEVSKELGVRYVLEGSVRKADNRVRVTAQLVDAATGYHLWAERYDRELQDIFALQDEIRRQIVTALAVTLTAGEQARLQHPPPTNLEAYDFFLRGLEYLRLFTQETHIQARQMFERAIALDPRFAAAHASLGWTYWVVWAWQWSRDLHTLEQALTQAQQALSLDASLHMAHQLMGWVYLWKKQYAQAIAAGERTLTLAPNEANGYAGLGDILSCAGRPRKALDLVAKAMRLNPRYPSWYLFELGFAQRLTGDLQQALITQKRVITRNPDFLFAHVELAAVHSELGHDNEAQAEVTEVLRVSPDVSLEGFRRRLPYKDPAVLEHFLAILRKAGLK